MFTSNNFTIHQLLLSPLPRTLEAKRSNNVILHNTICFRYHLFLIVTHLYHLVFSLLLLTGIP